MKRSLALLLFLAALGLSPIAAQPIDLREVKLEVREATLDLDERIRALERARMVLLGLLGANLLGLPLAYVLCLQQAGKKMAREIDRIIETERGKLLDLIAERDRDQELRRESEVCIVSNGRELERVLWRHGFRKIRSLRPTDALEALGQADAVVLDLEDGLDEQQALTLAEGQGLGYALAFRDGRVDLPSSRFAFTNSHVTLFSRLQELLKYQRAAGRG